MAVYERNSSLLPDEQRWGEFWWEKERTPQLSSLLRVILDLYDGPSFPWLSWLPEASASGAGDPEASTSTRHRCDKTYCNITCAHPQLRILDRVLVVMGKSQVISEIKRCQECKLRKLGQIETDASLISVGKSWKSSHTNRKRSRKRLLLRGQIINLCEWWQPPFKLTKPICV